jgi:group I intron endonuclease
LIGVYAIVNTVNDRQYIGSSSRIFKRWNEHLKDLFNNSHGNKYLQKDFIKYGYCNFSFKIIDICTIEELSKLELRYIEQLDDGDYNVFGLKDVIKSKYSKVVHKKLFTERPLSIKHIQKVFNYILETKTGNISHGIRKISRGTKIIPGEAERIRNKLIELGYLKNDNRQTIILKENLNLKDFREDNDNE